VQRTRPGAANAPGFRPRREIVLFDGARTAGDVALGPALQGALTRLPRPRATRTAEMGGGSRSGSSAPSS